ncbi:MAG: hypothetical protein GWN54_06260, partial [Gammaproteobacteria bacterium]|nr:hypothetical protein [Gammaproteobacteria bacterium]NIV20225.1 hypothetical protein [Gammaproteobacteria bacterium]
LRDDREHPLSGEQQRLVRWILERGGATMQMIDDLLNISRIHTGKIRLQPRFVDGAVVVDAAIARLRHLAGEKGVQVRND